MKQEPALYVENHIKSTNTQKEKRVPVDAEICFVGIQGVTPLGKAPVYNMEVDEYHNFSVNSGIIVHNCMDATRYFVKTMRLVQKNNKKQRKSIFDGAQ